MEIKELYIENFGKLSQMKKSFSGGLNSIVEDNGYGKTTLAAFIRAMLYGLDDTRSTKLEENPRKRYEPWGGGAFGGWLSIKHRGRSYRIERSFGKKASDDTFSLIDLDTGLPSNDFSERLGEDIFGIDEDGFERTVFLSERNLSGKNTNPTIAAKLSNITFADGDIGGFDIAIKLLEERRKFYQKRGGSGEIKDTNTEISALEEKIKVLREKKESSNSYEKELTEVEKKLGGLKAKKAELLRRQAEVSGMQKRANLEIRYREMCASMREDEQREKELAAFFERKMPTSEELAHAKAVRDEIARIKDELARLGETSDVGDHRYFEKRAPESEDMAQIRAAADTVRACEARLAELPDKPTSPLASVPKMGEAEDMIARMGNARKAPGPLTSATLLTVGVLISILGTVLAIFVNPYLAAVAIVGFLTTIVGIYCVLTVKSKEKFDKKVMSFIHSCLGDFADDSDVLACLEKIKEEAYTYHMARLRYDEIKYTVRDLEQKISRAGETITEIAEKYNEARDISPKELAEAMLDSYSKYTVLHAIRQKSLSDSEARKQRLQALTSEQENFLSLFDTDAADPLSEIERCHTEYLVISRSLADRRGKARQFAVQNGIDPDVNALPRGEAPSGAELGYELADVEESIIAAEGERIRLSSEYASLGEELERIDEYEERLRELYEKVQRYTDNLAVINKTKSILTNAKDLLTARYLDKARQGFEKYMTLINEECGYFTIDTSFVITKTDLGKSRSEDFYSRGTRDLHALAMRLSLIDALYEDSMPPIILDDPFSAFDDKHLELALAALKKLAKSRQIFYFTCTRSRKA